MTSGDGKVLASFVGALGAVTSPADLTTVLTDTLATMGFRHACYHVVRLEGTGHRLPYVMHNYGESWAEHYFKEGYLDVDPILQSRPDRILPFFWRDAVEVESLSKLQIRLFEEAADAGVREGYSVPIPGMHGDYATLSVIADDVKGGDALVAEKANLLHLMAIYFDRRARSPLINANMTSRRQKTLLSPREQEMLRWTAEGKTSGEISSIVRISVKSVESHLENAKRKLGTYSKTHAVVVALTRGLLTM
ncbi:MAG: LuxR family transcriptional regulator [Rhodospirillum sp.]|nr:LuxR family transcriptional regulator [Rhodospirillum sp.]MCF8487598.1 LuxR family transcriptional regulator [Rhodospirillum sp.]MCF8500253.1 LuxR family transcriptional regulator [Rhodospirillum sp.]